jgi:predicted ATPase
VFIGQIAKARTHLDQAVSLYDPVRHRPLATRFGHDPGVAALCYHAIALWLLGYSDAALADSHKSLNDARQFGQAGTLMYALFHTSLHNLFCGDYPAAGALAEELIILAGEKATAIWKGFGTMEFGGILAQSGRATEAVQMINAGATIYRSTGATVYLPFYLPLLASAYAQLGQFDDAWRCIGEARTAAKTTKETWCEAEINRMAGEIALTSPEPKAATAEEHFKRALAIAREQQAKSWELRAAMSMARLWRDQGKRDEARELLAPVYGWFIEGFDTRDLKEAKELLDELAA